MIAFTLFEADVSLYPAGPGDEPALDTPVWIGACAERLRISGDFIVAETRPVGRRYPKRHPLVLQHQISIGRVWVQEWDTLETFNPTNGRFVLDIVWWQENVGAVADEEDLWKRRTYYGVTIRQDELESNDLNSTAGQFSENQVFDAEYYVETGGSGTPPALSATIPMRVDYRGADGTVTLYTYDPDTKLFTETAAGITAGRASINYGGASTTILFGAFPSLQLNSGEVLYASFMAGAAPTITDQPRLEFWRGNARLATLVRDGGGPGGGGIFYASAISHITPTAADEKFLLYDEEMLNTLVMAIGPAGTEVLQIAAQTVVLETYGIPSAQVIGTPRALRTYTPTGIPTAQAIGSPRANLKIYPEGIEAPHFEADLLANIEVIDGQRGHDYAVSDQIFLAGGIYSDQATAQVTEVLAGGAIKTVMVNQPGLYSLVPDNPVLDVPELSSGNGSGAQFIATWSPATVELTGVTVIDPGHDYAISDEIFIAGGAYNQQASLTVNENSPTGGNIVSVTINVPGNYSVEPGNPAGQDTTSGSGADATFNLVWTARPYDLVGQPRVAYPFYPDGIPTDEAIGEPQINRKIYPAGLASVGVIGVPSATRTVTPLGIRHPQFEFGQDLIGFARLLQTFSPTGIPTAQAIGSPQLNVSIAPEGIPTAEAIGVPTAVV